MNLYKTNCKTFNICDKTNKNYRNRKAADYETRIDSNKAK